MDNYSSMASDFASQTNNPDQLIDSINSNKEFTKSGLMMMGQGSLGATGAKFVAQLKGRFGDQLKSKLNISSEENGWYI